MNVRPYRKINRKKTKKIMVGNIPVGGNSLITVQSMTNTPTHDIKNTIIQINELSNAGADIVRVSCPDEEGTQALRKIIKKTDVPIVADIHFHYKRAIEAAKAGADCLRINPGNIGSPEKVKEVIKAAKDYNCSMRIGVNAGSLEKKILEKYKSPNPDALVESALNNIKMLEDGDFYNFKVSVKASDVFLSVLAYEKLSKVCQYPLHIGITEAGGLKYGTVQSSIGIGRLLWAGIGDTIRVSLSANPIEEVRVGFEILKSLGIRNKGVTIIACPSCARQNFDVIDNVKKIEERLSHISEPITLSILGCVVNGPGEAKDTNIGITGGGKYYNQVYINGNRSHRMKQSNFVDQVVELVENYIKEMA